MFAFIKNLFKSQYPDLLEVINLQVNYELAYVKDINNYGVSDVWVKNPKNKQGDCEDYALTKQDRLVRAGIPVEDLELQMAFFIDKNDDKVAHAVLVYKDTWVLDSLSDIIWKKSELDYFGWLRPGEYKRKEVYNGEYKKS